MGSHVNCGEWELDNARGRPEKNIHDISALANIIGLPGS